MVNWRTKNQDTILISQEYESIIPLSSVILNCKIAANSGRDAMLGDCWTCIWRGRGMDVGSVPFFYRDTRVIVVVVRREGSSCLTSQDVKGCPLMIRIKLGAPWYK